MTQEELNKVLKAHKHYLAQDCEGWEKMKANLTRADLTRADLTRADLREADLTRANLAEANLRWANLAEANLRRADLRGADLREANLREADLRRADLTRADLRRAEVRGTDLKWANLAEANLRRADLRGANLREADLRRADLRRVIYNETTAFFALTCPEEGEFVAWKKVKEAIVKLRIPAEAKRSSATSRKCRCEFAEVLEFQNIDGTPYGQDEVTNYNYVKTVYKVGKVVRPDSWDEDRWNECSNGIHFFITRDEAVNY